MDPIKPQTPEQQPAVKHQYRAFWPIIIIAVLSALVGGLIVWVTFNDSLADDISSMTLRTHKAKQQPTSTSTLEKLPNTESTAK